MFQQKTVPGHGGLGPMPPRLFVYANEVSLR